MTRASGSAAGFADKETGEWVFAGRCGLVAVCTGPSLWKGPGDIPVKMRLNIPRVIASLLAHGACFWGILLSPLVAESSEKPMVFLTFGPGYVVTLGYLILVFIPPPLPARLFIWGLSVLVQGAWLVWIGVGLVQRLVMGGKWWSDRNGGKPWPKDSVHDSHPRPLKDGGDPLFIEPSYDSSIAPHMIPQPPDGLTDFQRWGAMGGRPRDQ